MARLVALAAGIIAIPLVTLTLGTEALGLVGVYATLQALLGLFDLGLPVAANHRLAIMISRDVAPLERAAMVRTLEALFWSLVAIFLLAGFLLRGSLAAWLNVVSLPRETVDSALLLMISAAVIRFPVAFYSNVLFAYNRHIYPNAIVATSAALRIAAALVALVAFHVGIVGYFAIQLIGSVIEVALLATGAWAAQLHRWIWPRLGALRGVASMAGGLTAVSIVAVMFAQIDKVIISRMLSLGDFGLYSAGYTFAAGLAALSYPIGNAVFPQLSQNLDGKSGEVVRIVHSATELTILVLLPLGCVMVMQTQAVLALFFLVKSAPSTLASILPYMLLGGIALGFATLPHLFQIAARRLATVIYINAGLLLPYAALIVAGTYEGGVVGAALAFAVFNIARLLVYWGVLGSRRSTRSIWWPAVFLTIATTGAGLILARLPTLIQPHGFEAILIAAMSVLTLTGIAALAMPISRRSLLTFRNDGGKI